MASFKLVILVFLLLLGTAAKGRFVDLEQVQVNLKDTDDVMDDDACQDCIHIIELLKHLMLDEQFQDDLQVKLKTALEAMCNSLPDEISKMCHDQVESKLPLALTFITSLMVPNDVCSYIGLCNGQLRGQMHDLLMNHMQKTIRVPTATLNSSIPCTVCTYIVDVLQCLIPKTETLITTLLSDVCQILPPLVRAQCTGIVKKYVKMLINILLGIISPDSLCSALRLCPNMKTSDRAVFALSDCDSCLTLVVLTHRSLGNNATELQAASFLRTVCQSHPDALPKCESFTQRHGNQILGLLGKEMTAMETCERADLCVKDRRDSAAAGDPCTLGPSYSCKDQQTAEKCGMAAFCQKNMWN
ncbi:prosaposin isoform X2 [Colossoma macropomum]|uniref:prosaposin isoform X2 n=1 Tax=Colossoma macropomum TaxID=42526 RepID=UPI00186502AE|nr:prosaposin isoform X2 [Colossoma macropomum]